ncbi:RNA 2',3'-cyclic phosphodiesterase [Propionicimonas sp.]|uniref:RNA 2',3'-cyclic phosphodiesterase n=1 Tax=Propionicimonas sp. TaxID=1955623 RepID=UPI0039E2F909
MAAAGDRLFVAVLPPPAVVESWESFLEPRRDAEPGFRWTLAGGWHVTCAFMASVPPQLSEPLEEALADVAARTTSFGIAVSGGGAFPDPDHARALWLGVVEGVEPLGRLARRCRNAAAGCGIAVDGARFRPHLTIARSGPTRARRWLTVLDAVPGAAWTVEEFVLLRSRLLPGGAGYETVGRYRLSPG